MVGPELRFRQDRLQQRPVAAGEKHLKWRPHGDGDIRPIRAWTPPATAQKMPASIAAIVEVPGIVGRCRGTSIRGSSAVCSCNAAAIRRRPGRIAPPTKAPSVSRASTVIADPASITTAGRPAMRRLLAATASRRRSIPAWSGFSSRTTQRQRNGPRQHLNAIAAQLGHTARSNRVVRDARRPPPREVATAYSSDGLALARRPWNPAAGCTPRSRGRPNSVPT